MVDIHVMVRNLGNGPVPETELDNDDTEKDAKPDPPLARGRE